MLTQIKLRSASAVFPDEVNLQICQEAFQLDRQDYAAARVGYDKQLVALFRAFYRLLESGVCCTRLSDSQLYRDPKSALQECLDLKLSGGSYGKRLEIIQRDLAEDFELLQLARPVRWSRLAPLRLANRRFNSIGRGFICDTVLFPAHLNPRRASLRLQRIQCARVLTFDSH